MKCDNCNQVLPDGSIFCPFCGTKIEPFIDEAESTHLTKDFQQSDLVSSALQNKADDGTKKKMILPLIIAAVVLLGVDMPIPAEAPG